MSDKVAGCCIIIFFFALPVNMKFVLFCLLLIASHPIRVCGSQSRPISLSSLSVKTPFRLGNRNILPKHQLLSHSKTIDGIASSSLVTLRGGGEDELVFSAYEWCINLGAPAALVAGAVVATLYENLRSGDLEIKKSDSNYVRFAKKGTTVLLHTAFALQIVSIFVTTVTGTMLLSRDSTNLVTEGTTPLSFLRENFEFEYLTSRLSFLQGLLNWLAAVGLEHTIPRPTEGQAALKMNRFVASGMLTLILMLLAFYNNHMTFYSNYFMMLRRFAIVVAERYVLVWPPRPLAFLFIPSIVITAVLGFRAFQIVQSPDKFDFSKDD